MNLIPNFLKSKPKPRMPARYGFVSFTDEAKDNNISQKKIEMFIGETIYEFPFWSEAQIEILEKNFHAPIFDKTGGKTHPKFEIRHKLHPDINEVARI